MYTMDCDRLLAVADTLGITPSAAAEGTFAYEKWADYVLAAEVAGLRGSNAAVRRWVAEANRHAAIDDDDWHDWLASWHQLAARSADEHRW